MKICGTCKIEKEETEFHFDHIIPHSTFHYETMDCQEFKDCWALSNLRPLSAKQNLLDGISRVRHDLVKEESNQCQLKTN
jgi:hypothetical protein